jgi:hypothetical protein
LLAAGKADHPQGLKGQGGNSLLKDGHVLEQGNNSIRNSSDNKKKDGQNGSSKKMEKNSLSFSIIILIIAIVRNKRKNRATGLSNPATKITTTTTCNATHHIARDGRDELELGFLVGHLDLWDHGKLTGIG